MKILLLTIVLAVIAVIVLARVYGKLGSNGKKALNTILVILCIFLAYLVWASIWNPVRWNAERDTRYKAVVKNIEKLREAEVAYHDLTGKYSDNPDSLFAFIDTAKFKIVESKEVIRQVYDSRFKINKDVKEVVKTVKGTVSVKDSLFKGVDLRKTLDIPYTEGKQFTFKTGEISNGANTLPTFVIFALKKDILHDMNPDYVHDEEVTISGIPGDRIQVGDLERTTTAGNWTIEYEPSGSGE